MSEAPPEVLPATTDAADEPVLLPYQRAWLEDGAELKVSEKSRRTGLTWAEAADDVLIAATEGGQNVYYIGYNQDMAVEYIEAVAMWARAFNQAAGEIEEGLWDEDAEDKHIKTFTVRFPGSGRRIVALSSRPANLRGKQGVVVIDEAAFHDQLPQLLKAAMALLIWGGKVRVISTHNGVGNPFNELVTAIRAGERKGSVHRIEFREAVEQGLYRRVCQRLGLEWTAEGEAEWVRSVYDFYGEDASEELDVIPREGEGAWLTRAAIEAAMVEAPVVRWAAPEGFAQQPAHIREAEARDWCERELAGLLAELPAQRNHYFGEDFGRSGDLTAIFPLVETQHLQLLAPFVVELRNVPFEQQRQILFYVVDRLPRFAAGALDATGNGAYLAEVAMQRYGSARIEEVKLSADWYRQHMPRVKAGIEDRTVGVPRDADVLADLRAVRVKDGVAQVPRDARSRGSDGRERHGDTAIALALGVYAAYALEPAPIEYTPAPPRSLRWDGAGADDELADDLPTMERGAW